MALWVLCCILLFITSRGYDWLTHQSWFMIPELSLPWLVLGGLGLAIASNYSAWQSLTTEKTLPAVTEDSSVLPSTPVPPAMADSPPRPQSSGNQAARRSASISFTVTTTKASPSEPSL